MKMYIIATVLAFTALVVPSNAYYFDFANYAPNSVVQLYFEGSEARDLAFWPVDAADALIDFAQDYGRTVTRSKASIGAEISAHAFAWLGGERKHSNPMDISLR